MRTVTTALKQAVNAQQTDACFITLITITSANIVTPLRVADESLELLPTAGGRGVISNGNEYVYLPFQLSLPNEDDTGIGRARITIDNVSREIVQAVRSSTSQLSMKIEIVLASDPDTVEITMDNFILDSVNYDALSISGDLSVQFFDLEPYPSGRFTPSLFPGLF